MGILSDILTGIPTNAVLREKIEAVEAKYASLDTENAILKDDNRQLKIENQKLRDEVNSLRRETDRLPDKVALEEMEVKILAYVGKSTEPFDVEGVARDLQLNPVKVKYFIEKLRESRLVTLAGRMRGQPPQYRVDQKGREYIIENDLI